MRPENFQIFIVSTRLISTLRCSKFWDFPWHRQQLCYLESRERLGASLQNFHDNLAPSLNSKTGRGRVNLLRASAGVTVSGAGDRSSITGDCFNWSGEGIDLPCCCSNSLDMAGDPMELFSDSCVESTA
ncbi:hypothetical protein LWI28_004863 [Acer negundo]|uniref:Uncharacterized protein n=1 Tax=Acer negundo TaxID=4023 RepID=A0AAD5NF82_ACENE|nr:hypothetical protein LWI28_004863 [Acer negundo]